MATNRFNAGIAQLFLGICAPRVEGRSDGQLLRQFLNQRDESAFTALVERHGPMVLGVCRRVLENAADADDAFQATFLVLARNAASLARRGVLGDWLHGVARRTALNAKRLAAKRRAKERAMARSETEGATGRDDWLPLLDEELERLPANYRLPIVLCDLEGYTRFEAAKQLGWPEGTVAGRLARGRALLAERLVRRGVTVSVGGVAAALSQGSVSAALVAYTVKAAIAGAMSASVAALTQEMVKSMFLSKLKMAAVGAMAVVVSVAICYGVLAGTQPSGESKSLVATVVEPDRDDEKPAAPLADGVDHFGDPLPPEALARLGTIRLRHGNIVQAIVFAPDGKTFASAGVDGTVHVWETATGKEMVRIESHREAGGGKGVDALAYTPDGKLLAGTRMNEPPCLWEVSTGKEIRDFGGKQRRGQSVTMSPDGKFLAYGGWPNGEGPWWLADLNTGKELRQYDAKWTVFSPESKTLVYGGAKGDAAVHLVDASTGKDLRRFDGHQSHAVQAAYSPDGTILATADDRTLRLIDVAGGQTREITRAEGQSLHANTLMFSPDGTSLAAVGAGGKMLRLVNVATGKTIGAHELSGKRENVWSILFTRDSKTVISGHEDGHLRFWAASTAAKVKEIKAHSRAVSRLALSPNGRILATTSWTHSSGDFSVRLWEMETGKPLALPLGPQTSIRFLVFSPDGRHAATGIFTGETQLWETSTGKLLRQWKVFGPLAFSADGQTLICGGWQDGKIRVLDVATGEEIRQFQSDTKQGISSVNLARDGRTLATNGSDNVVRLWDVASWRELQDFGGAQKEHIFDLVLSPDGKLLAGNNQKAILLWDTGTGKLVRELIEPKSHITGVSFSGDGKLLASSHWGAPPEWGHWIQVRDVATGKEIRKLKTATLDTIAFSPDGRTLIGGGQHNREVFIWEVATGQLRQKFSGHQGSIATVAFAPKGRTIASGSADGSVLIWDVTGARSRQKPAPDFTADQISKLWIDLAAEDAALAYEAMRTLRSAPSVAAALLERHLRPVPTVDAKRVTAALANLDNSDFKIRNQANKDLEAMGESAESALREALGGNPTVEVTRRVEQLLRRFEGAESLRTGRALELLEHIGNGAARRLLTALARGSSQARLTQEARAALDRLDR